MRAAAAVGHARALRAAGPGSRRVQRVGLGVRELRAPCPRASLASYAEAGEQLYGGRSGADRVFVGSPEIAWRKYLLAAQRGRLLTLNREDFVAALESARENVARTLSYIGPDGARLLPTSPLPVTYAYKPLLRASLELIAVYNDMRAWASGSVGATELADVLEAYARLPTRLPPHTAEVNWSGMGGGGAAYAKWLPLEAALSLFLDAQSSSPDTLESRHLEALLAAYAHHGHTRAHLRQAVELLAQATRQDAEDASVTNDAPETDVGGEEATGADDMLTDAHDIPHSITAALSVGVVGLESVLALARRIAVSEARTAATAALASLPRSSPAASPAAAVNARHEAVRAAAKAFLPLGKFVAAIWKRQAIPLSDYAFEAWLHLAALAGDTVAAERLLIEHAAIRGEACPSAYLALVHGFRLCGRRADAERYLSAFFGTGIGRTLAAPPSADPAEPATPPELTATDVAATLRLLVEGVHAALEADAQVDHAAAGVSTDDGAPLVSPDAHAEALLRSLHALETMVRSTSDSSVDFEADLRWQRSVRVQLNLFSAALPPLDGPQRRNVRSLAASPLMLLAHARARRGDLAGLQRCLELLSEAVGVTGDVANATAAPDSGVECDVSLGPEAPAEEADAAAATAATPTAAATAAAATTAAAPAMSVAVEEQAAVTGALESAVPVSEQPLESSVVSELLAESAAAAAVAPGPDARVPLSWQWLSTEQSSVEAVAAAAAQLLQLQTAVRGASGHSCVSTVLVALCAGGNFQKAWQLWEQVSKSGHSPDATACDALLHLCAARGDVGGAESLIAWMDERNFQLSRAALTHTIAAYTTHLRRSNVVPTALQPHVSAEALAAAQATPAQLPLPPGALSVGGTDGAAVEATGVTARGRVTSLWRDLEDSFVPDSAALEAAIAFFVEIEYEPRSRVPLLLRLLRALEEGGMGASCPGALADAMLLVARRHRASIAGSSPTLERRVAQLVDRATAALDGASPADAERERSVLARGHAEAAATLGDWTGVVVHAAPLVARAEASTGAGSNGFLDVRVASAVLQAAAALVLPSAAKGGAAVRRTARASPPLPVAAAAAADAVTVEAVLALAERAVRVAVAAAPVNSALPPPHFQWLTEALERLRAVHSQRAASA